MTKMPGLGLVGGLFISASGAGGVVLASYQFGTAGSETSMEMGAAYAPNTVSPNVTATNVSDIAGTVGLEISSAAVTPTGAPFLRLDNQGASTTAAAAIAGKKYFQVAVTPDAPFRINPAKRRK